MPPRKRINTISRLTRTLLAEGESERVDFKRTPEGISAEDLVAFANSEAGGNILAGVDEQLIDGTQVGNVRGCDVSDGSILQILNKAVGCIPPVSINVFTENIIDKPILRVEVPSSPTKPHCTPKGIYCRRDGARNRPLHPTELLKVFLETEASSFAARFEVAAKRITEELSDLELSLHTSIENMSDQLGWAGSQLGDTESYLHRIHVQLSGLTTDLDDASTRLRVLFRQDKREDPIRERERLDFVNTMISEIKKNSNAMKAIIHGHDIKIQSISNLSADITQEEAKMLFKVASDHIRKEEHNKGYTISAKPPEKCTEAELDTFSAKVSEGGEVANGVRQRAVHAFRLGFISFNGSVVGTAAIKQPKDEYRRSVFSKARSSLEPNDYSYELGWIFLDEQHRKKGQMTRLIQMLMPLAKDAAMFATTRTTNTDMQSILKRLKFSPNGAEYRSEVNNKELLNLFVLEPQTSYGGVDGK